MLTVAAAALDLAGLLGCSSLPYNAPDLLARIQSDLMRARKTMFLRNGIENVLKTDDSAVLFQPAQVSGTITKYTKGPFTSISGFQSYMDGCTIQPGNNLPSGDTLEQNRLYFDGTNWYLRYPWRGATGSTTWTVYHDSVMLNPLAISLERPVSIEGFRELTPLVNEADLHQSSWAFGWGYGGFTDSGRLGTAIQPGGYPTLTSARNPATPLCYLPEFLPSSAGLPTLRLRVDPLPDAEYLLTWWNRLLPSNISSLTDTTTLLVPNGMDEACFMPVARAFISEHPLFTGNRSVVMEAAKQAQADLARITNPNTIPDLYLSSEGGF